MSSIEGIDKLLSKLNSLGVNGEKVLEKSIRKNINFVKGEAKTLCPVAEIGGGTLRNSINSKVEKDSSGIAATVSTNNEYAAYQEFGTGQRGESSASPPKYDGSLSYRQDWKGIPAQPFLYPALKNNEDRILEDIKGDLKNEIRSIAGR